MRFLLLLSIFLLVSCSSTQKISHNVFMASCDGVWGGCQGQMEKTCPNGYTIIAEKTEWLPQSIRKHMHFQCNEFSGREVSSLPH